MYHTELLLTYDDYLTLPNDGKRYEIIEGELTMSPAPEPDHQDVIGNIYSALRNFVRAHSLGKVYVSPIDVVLSMTDIVQPDIVFIAAERLAFVKKKNIVAAPDIVIEVLSPSTEINDRTRKKVLYEKFGVKEYWIADMDAMAVEIYSLQGSQFGTPKVFKNSESVASAILTGFSFPPPPNI